MTLKFYCVSGSPFSWKVWLSLERKKLDYEVHILSADAGDLRRPEFLSLNPRGKVPVIVDGAFVLRESGVIVDYLDKKYAASGGHLWPQQAEARAAARLLAHEVDAFIYPSVRRLVAELIVRKDGLPDRSAIAEAKATLAEELARIDGLTRAPFFSGPEPSASDFALYPFLALFNRVASRKPEVKLSEAMPEGLLPWMRQIEALAYFTETLPPHWRSS
ncbi:MAG: glutathione S-transferase family protein [Hyphomicrobium sp.]